MLEHFSARAVAAIQLAHQEARRLEFSQVDGGHLLLGLAGEGNGVAARALRRVGLDLRGARTAAERLWGRGYEQAQDVVPSEEATRIFEAAVAIAEQTEPLLVDTQDLLRAILAQAGGKGAELLREAGVVLGELTRCLMEERSEELAGMAASATTPGPPKHFHPRLLAPLARRVLDQAVEMTSAAGHALVGTEQLLASMLAVEEGSAAAILRQNGLTRLDVEAIAQRVIGRGSGAAGTPGRSKWVDEALEQAWRSARDGGHEQIGTMHLLMGLLRLDAGGALHLMDLLRINIAGIQIDAEQAFADHPRDLEPAV